MLGSCSCLRIGLAVTGCLAVHASTPTWAMAEGVLVIPLQVTWQVPFLDLADFGRPHQFFNIHSPPSAGRCLLLRLPQRRWAALTQLVQQLPCELRRGSRGHDRIQDDPDAQALVVRPG